MHLFHCKRLGASLFKVLSAGYKNHADINQAWVSRWVAVYDFKKSVISATYDDYIAHNTTLH